MLFDGVKVKKWHGSKVQTDNKFYKNAPALEWLQKKVFQRTMSLIAQHGIGFKVACCLEI